MTDWDDLTEKEQLLTYISDVHKDAYGFRPRSGYSDMSVPELKVELDRLCDEASEEADRIDRLQIQNWQDLKNHYASLVNMGAKDFRQALEWDMHAEDCIYEGGYMDFCMYCYSKGIKYSKERTFERLAA